MSDVPIYTVDNFKLLVKLHKDIGATGYGSLGNFFEVHPEWRCPCCYRSKPEISRLDRNGDLLCAIHWHHDHYMDLARKIIDPRVFETFNVVNAVRDSLARFPPTQICNDCNVVEPVAKKLVGASEHFSFAPYEIASFIAVRPNVPHACDPVRAAQAYESAKPAMALISARLRAIKAAKESNGETFEPLAAPAMRVLQEAWRKMKAAE